MNSLLAPIKDGTMPTVTADAIRKIFCKYVSFADLSEAMKALSQGRSGGWELMENDGYSIIRDALKVSPYLDRDNEDLEDVPQATLPEMYGNAAALCYNMKKFADFPGRHTYFGCSPAEPYGHTPVIMTSLKGNKYMMQHDLFVRIQQIVLSKHSYMLPELSRTVLIVNLKAKEKLIENSFELIPYTDDILDDLMNALDEKSIDEKLKEMLNDPEQNNLGIRKLTESTVLHYFKRLIPKSDDPDLQETLSRATSMFYTLHMSRDIRANFTGVYLKIKLILNTVLDFIDSRPDLFMPYTNENPHPQPLVIRLFVDEFRRFIFEKELQRALNRTVYKNSPCLVDNPLRMMEVRDNFVKSMHFIDFIPTLVSRTRCRTFPITSPDNRFCQFLGDVFLEEIVTQVFNTFKYMSVSEAEKVFSMEKHFPPYEAERCLIPVQEIPKITIPFYDVIMRAAKKKSNGRFPLIDQRRFDNFTREQFEAEVARLKLDKIFPNIKKSAEIAYFVTRSSKAGVLKPSDFQRSWHITQLHCFFAWKPVMAIFLHHQNCCHRIVGMVCPYCPQRPEQELNRDKDELVVVQQDLNFESPQNQNEENEVEKIVFPEVSNSQGHKLSREAICKLIRKYQFIQIMVESEELTYFPDDGLSMIETLFQKVGRMNGQTPKEFLDSLNTFKNFPKNYNILRFNNYEPLNNDVQLLKSNKERFFIYKYDLITLFQNRALAYLCPTPKIQVFEDILVLTIREVAYDFDFTCELIEYHENMLQDFDNTMKNFLSNEVGIMNQRGVNYLNRPPLTPSELFRELKGLCPRVNSQEFYDILEKHSHEFYTMYDSQDPKYLLIGCFRLVLMMDIVREYILKNPKYFKPWGADNLPEETSFCRVFTDSLTKKWYMSHQEYSQALVPDGNLNTLKLNLMKRVDEEFLKKSTNVEFLFTPIIRTNHRTVPILYVDGSHRIPASDVLFEVLHFYIECCRMFYRCTMEQTMFVLNSISEHFPSKEKEKLFYSCEKVDELCQSTVLNEKFDPESAQLQQRKTTFDDGFTIDELRKWVSEGPLIKLFPHILTYVDNVYKNLRRNRRGETLRDVDFSIALERLQLICLFDLKPSLLEFLHNQESCLHIYNLNCRYCIGVNLDLGTEQIDHLLKDYPFNRETGFTLEPGDVIEVEMCRIMKKKKAMAPFHSLVPTDSSPPPSTSIFDRKKEKKAAKKAARALRAQMSTESGTVSEPLEKTLNEETSPEETAVEKTEEKMEEIPEDTCSSRRDSACSSKTSEYKKTSITSSTSSSLTKSSKEDGQKVSKSCEKCVRTSDRCIKVSKELEEANKKILLLEKDLRVMDRKYKELEETTSILINEDKRKDEAIKDLKTLNRESVDVYKIETERLQKALDRKTIESEKMGRLAEQLMNQMAVKHPIEMSEDLKAVLEELEEKSAQLYVDNLEALNMANKVAYLLEIDPVREDGPGEFLNYRIDFNIYKNALEHNINSITSNPQVKPEELIPLPSFPEFSEEFLNMYKEAVNEEEGRKCSLCLKSACKEKEKPKKKISRRDARMASWMNKNWTCWVCRKIEQRFSEQIQERTMSVEDKKRMKQTAETSKRSENRQK